MKSIPTDIFSRWITAVCAVILGGLCGLGMVSGQQNQGSGNPEADELRGILQVSRQQLARSEAQRKELANALAETEREAMQLRKEALDIREKLEAFGIDLFSASKDSLEQKVVKAARDMHIMKQESDRQRKAIHELSEAFMKYLAATPQAPENARGEAQEAIAKATRALDALVDSDSIYAQPLEKSQIVSFDPENSLVVLNAGRKTGVRVGTPITVERDDRALFSAVIVQVRESISGAVLLDNLVGAGANIKIGDRIRPTVSRTNL